METSLNPAINLVVREFKTALQSLYGELLHGVVLCGSCARGDYDEESDINLMVLLTDENVSSITKGFRLSELTMNLILEYGKAISPLPVAAQKYASSFMSVYQNARWEGLFV